MKYEILKFSSKIKMSSGQKKKSMTLKSKSRLSEKNVNNKKEQQNRSAEESSRKKLWSKEDLKESMKPTNEELKYREEKLKESDIFEKSSKLFRCTKCMKSFSSVIKTNQKVPVHPILGVLMCQNCNDYYEDGEFSLDSDGEDKYCRWCGEGGTIFGCSKCICGFCATCLKKHFQFVYFKKVRKDDNWLCFFCNPKPLWHLRFVCSLAIQKSEGVAPEPSSSLNITDMDINNDQSSTSGNLTIELLSKSVNKNSKKLIYSDDESEGEAHEVPRKKAKLSNSSLHSSMQENGTDKFEDTKDKVLNELKKVLKLSEYQLSFGVDWSIKTLLKLENSDLICTNKGVANECRKIKWFLSMLSTYLVQFCNCVNALEKSLSDSDEDIPSTVPDKSQPSYTTILQFLGFINTQVKIFMEKGIPLTDILNAELHNDSNLIGFIKKLNSAVSPSKSKKNITPIKPLAKSSPNQPKNTKNKKAVKEQKKAFEDKDGNDSDSTDDFKFELNSSKKIGVKIPTPKFKKNKEHGEKQKDEAKDKSGNISDSTDEQNFIKNSPEQDKVSSSKKSITPAKHNTKCSPSHSKDTKNKEDLEQEIGDEEDKDENNSDSTDENNFEMNSSEKDKESSSCGTLVGLNDIKTPDIANDFQEILAILENA